MMFIGQGKITTLISELFQTRHDYFGTVLSNLAKVVVCLVVCVVCIVLCMCTSVCSAVCVHVYSIINHDSGS